MKTIRTTSPFLRRNVTRPLGALALAGALLAGAGAQAHISYTGRNFGTFSGQTNATVAITNQNVTGNYGWADSADGILGDTHRGRAFRFRLENRALVTLTVAANPAATTNSLGALTPAFSIYSGLAGLAPFPPSQTTNAASADHDGSPSSVAWRIGWVQQNIDTNATDETPTDGSWHALGDWKIGGDGDLPGDFAQLSSFTYRGSAASTVSGGSVSGTFALPAGDYTLFVGGNDLANKTAGTALSPHGIAATFTVTPPPPLGLAQKVFVHWPAGTGTNWVLQSAPALAPENWTSVTNAPVTVDGTPGVVLDKSAAQQFFRFNYVP